MRSREVHPPRRHCMPATMQLGVQNEWLDDLARHQAQNSLQAGLVRRVVCLQEAMALAAAGDIGSSAVGAAPPDPVVRTAAVGAEALATGSIAGLTEGDRGFPCGDSMATPVLAAFAAAWVSAS